MNTPTPGEIRPQIVLPADQQATQKHSAMLLCHRKSTALPSQRAALLEAYYDRSRGALASLHFELGLLRFDCPDLADRLTELQAPIREAFAATSRVETAFYDLIRGE